MSSGVALPYPTPDPAQVRLAAARLKQLAAVASSAARSLQADAEDLARRWQGPASTACGGELRAVAALALRAGEPLAAASHTLLSFADVVALARWRIDGLRVAYDEAVLLHQGDVAAVAPLFARRHGRILDEVRAAALATARRLAALSASAAQVGATPPRSAADQEAVLAATLPMLAAQRALLVPGGGLPPPPATAPELVSAWWRVLTPDERARHLRAQPAALGRLAGLPAADRSRANERVLDALVTMLLAKTRRTELEQRWLANCLVIRRQLLLVRRRRDPVTGAPVQAQLLVFNPRAYDGDGRAAMAVGDLDTAHNVAVLVPGLNADVGENWPALAQDAHRVQRLSRRQDPTRGTAVVAWLAYNAPTFWTVGNDDLARKGARLLRRDLRAVTRSRPDVPNLTLVGHSYGSTTVGIALARRLPGVSAAVLLGSPGSGAERARELHLPAGRVFVGASSRDPVSYLDRYGADPTHASFGAVRFDAEDVTRHPYRLAASDHVKYFRPASESLDNIVKVVVGDYDDVARAPYRAEWPLLFDGIGADPEASRAPTRTRP